MTKIVYEKSTCGRCAGSGRHSFNMVDGSVCYGCAGSGEKLTKRGAEAKRFADERLETTAAEFTKLTGRRAIFRSPGCPKMVFSAMMVSGAGYTPLCRMKDGTVVEGAMTLCASSKVRLIPTDDDKEAIMAYQSSLTKAGKISKRA